MSYKEVDGTHYEYIDMLNKCGVKYPHLQLKSISFIEGKTRLYFGYVEECTDKDAWIDRIWEWLQNRVRGVGPNT